MKKGFWIGLIIVAAIFFLAGGYIFITISNYLNADKWEVHDPIPDDRRKFYANTALMPELADDFERFAIKGIRDFDYMVETYSFSGTDEMYESSLKAAKKASQMPFPAALMNQQKTSRARLFPCMRSHQTCLF